MDDLTPRQREALDAIRTSIDTRGFPPSRNELADMLGIAHGASVNVHLVALQAKGYIDLAPDVNRGIRLLDGGSVPLVDWVEPVGEVAAGEPILADPRIVGRIPNSVAAQFRPRPDYFLTVRGDSMSRREIHDGDLVAVRSTPVAESGEIVVARFGDEVTLKRFRRVSERHVELHPESHSPAHEVMRFDLAKHLLHIDGVLVGHMRGKTSVERDKTSDETD